jgi:sialic acid synthase SpsE
MTNAIAMADAALNAGADAVKFQMYVPELINDKSLHQFLRQARLTRGEHLELKSYCEISGIDYLCSAFDCDSLDALNSMGMETYKVPSGQIHSETYLRRLASFGKFCIVSSGMCDIGDLVVADAVLTNNKVCYLHCNTAYPTPPCDANVRAIATIQTAFPHRLVGYSDHTLGVEAAAAAVTIGAKIIEKHFILSRKIQTPDTRVSLEPGELARYVDTIRRTETLLGDGNKIPQKSEVANMFRKDYR